MWMRNTVKTALTILFYQDGNRAIFACQSMNHRVHRVATAAFCRTFSDEGKISPGWCGWGVHAHPPLITFTLTSKVAVYAPAEWADQRYAT